MLAFNYIANISHLRNLIAQQICIIKLYALGHWYFVNVYNYVLHLLCEKFRRGCQLFDHVNVWLLVSDMMLQHYLYESKNLYNNNYAPTRYVHMYSHPPKYILATFGSQLASLVPDPLLSRLIGLPIYSSCKNWLALYITVSSKADDSIEGVTQGP